MANTDLANGFHPWGYIYPVSTHSKDATGSTPIYPGDLVKLESDGNMEIAAAGNRLLGASRDFLTGSLAGDTFIYDHPDQKFVGQDDGTGATSAQTHVGNQADHVAGTGSLVTFISAHEVDISSATTVTAGLKLLDIMKRPDVEVTTFTKWICRINEHELATTVGV
jgi:hypothetical protein